jgi:ubiquinone biosynthesis protein
MRANVALRPIAVAACSAGPAGPAGPRGERLRLALERLGPIFVKFGQVLSTRRDLLPPDIADELARCCRTACRPSPSRARWPRSSEAFGKPIDEVFAERFDPRRWPAPRSRRCISPRCKTADGEVAVKVLRPGMLPGHRRRPGAAAHRLAGWVERVWSTASA